VNRRPFIREVLGDALEPLRTGDMLIFEPCDRKHWDGMYAMTDGAIYLAQTVPGGVRLFRPNPLYGEHVVPRDYFNANVCGWKVAEIRFDGMWPGEKARLFSRGFDFDIGQVEEAAPLALAAA
jgi:hypothetical protein